jgi:DNA modification methylase
VNLIYVNPPFGTTNNFWDEAQDWPSIFKECFRILTNDGMLVIHCSIPFNYELIRAAPKPPSYSWYWKKDSPTCPLIANHQPLRIVEEILVWKNKKNTYYRQQEGTEARKSTYITKPDYFGETTKKSATMIVGKTRSHFLDMKRHINGFSTRPDEMVDLFIKSYTKPGDTVLDMFCYKGLSSKFCEDRKWIGIDKYFYPLLV